MIEGVTKVRVVIEVGFMSLDRFCINLLDSWVGDANCVNIQGTWRVLVTEYICYICSMVPMGAFCGVCIGYGWHNSLF